MAQKDTNYIPSNSSDLSDLEIPDPSPPSTQTSTPQISTPVTRPKKTIKTRPRKKARFHGVNYHDIKKPKIQFIETSPTISAPTSSQSSAVSTIASMKISTPSSSSKKLPLKLRLNEDFTKNVTIPNSNLIINSQVLQNELDKLTVCSFCRIGNMKLYECGRAGCATNLILKCNSCDKYSQFWSVSGHFTTAKIKIDDKIVIPKRNDMVFSSVIGGRLIGIGCNSLLIYHASLNLPLSPSAPTFNQANQSLVCASEFIAIQSMQNAKFELCDIHNIRREDRIEVVASYDGAYQQRGGKAGGGHSRYCFASAISIETGKVLSYGVACNSCANCSKYEILLLNEKITFDEYHDWWANHCDFCPAQFPDKASVHLESAIAPQVVSDALSRGIIFSGIVSDGDNKTDDALKKSGVYDSLNREIERHECLSHVCKRLKINLAKAQDRILKSSKSEKAFEKKKLTSEKGLSSIQIEKILSPKCKGTLVRDSTTRASWGESNSKEIKTISEAICGQIASYYRRAVQQNIGNIQDIIRAIQAIPYHLGANDSNAAEYHRFCPLNSDSWCKYNAAITTGNTPPSHPNFISDNCVKMILNLFSDFGYDSEEFVKKIASGKTSNHNESIHCLLFRMIKKTESVGMDIMKFGSALAVIRYNDGYQGILKLYKLLGIEITSHMEFEFSKLDKQRVNFSGRIINEQKKRYNKKQRRGIKVRKQIAKHGPGYTSSGYTGASKKLFSADDSSCSEEEDIAPLNIISPSDKTPIETLEDEDFCEICKGTDANRIVGIGLTVIPDDEEIDWIQCTTCSKWYHFLCIDLQADDIAEDEDWFCQDC